MRRAAAQLGVGVLAFPITFVYDPQAMESWRQFLFTLGVTFYLLGLTRLSLLLCIQPFAHGPWWLAGVAFLTAILFSFPPWRYLAESPAFGIMVLFLGGSEVFYYYRGRAKQGKAVATGFK